MKCVCALALLALSMNASAHPIEPLVTGSPMPVPQDYLAADGVYSALSAGATQQNVGFSLAVGIGGMAELSVGATIDATQGSVSPVVAGGKFMLVMEGRRGIDLSLAATFSSGGAVSGTVLAGRTLVPGFYLQAAAGVDGSSGPTMTTHTTPLAMSSMPRHGADLTSGSNLIVVHVATALQWAPRPRWIPTLEFAASRTFDYFGSHDDAEVVPEIIYLVEINHLSVKAGVPIGVTGATSYGVIASLDWQR